MWPGVVGAFHQGVHSEVVSDSESDEAWVVREEAPTESLQRVGNRSEPELCCESDVDSVEQVGHSSTSSSIAAV